MKPSPHEFQEALDAGKQHIILLGPSGVGKTEWQRRLTGMQEYPFSSVEIDARIGRNPRMAAFLDGQPGADEAEKMGNAFGTPWRDPGEYRRKEKAYLGAEQEEMAKLHGEMQQTTPPIVADLTGSAIYCREQLERVLSCGLGVYLKAGQAQYDVMRENFLRDPKPVCWGDVLKDWEDAVREKGPQANEKLPELYTRLLETRDKLYTKFADVILPWGVHRVVENPIEFLRIIKGELEVS